MTKFLVGKTYFCRSLCDYDCIFNFEVIARTGKTLTLKDGQSIIKRKILEDCYDTVEACRPYGSYSMAPYLRADKEGV